MTRSFKLTVTASVAFLTLTACNPASTSADNAALAAEQNAAAQAGANQMTDANAAGGMHDDMMGGGMMQGNMNDGMGGMPGNMPADKNDPMANSQSMKDKPMEGEMGDM